MVMGRPPKYQDRVSTSVSLERKLKIVAEGMGIDLSKALTQGIQFLIDYKFKTGEKIDPILLEGWREIKEQTLTELKEYLNIESDKQIALSEVIDSRNESKARLAEKIEVYDEDTERRITIKRSEYNPALHSIIKRGRK